MADSTVSGMANFSAQEKSTISTDRARLVFRVSRYTRALPNSV